jgi:hypothetical protein
VTRRKVLAVAAAMCAVSVVAACHDTCFLVAGCGDSERVAVEGRILETVSGVPIGGAVVTLLVHGAGGIDSGRAVTDEDGLFSIVRPLGEVAPDTLALRVTPPGLPGYLISPLDCKPVLKWGDACVLGPLVAQPAFPAFRFVFRSNVERPVANARVTFKRNEGATVAGLKDMDSVVTKTDAQGFARLFDPSTFPTSLDAVVGELTIELPAPIGKVVRQGYRVTATPQFNSSPIVVQPVGPSLSYVMQFTDSITGRGVADVEMRYARKSGIAASANVDTARSIIDGRAFLNLMPRTQGSITGDFHVTPKGSSLTTVFSNVVLSTFEADSSIIFARFKVGATGILYEISPP